MQSPNEADILQVKRLTGRDLIAVGLRWDSALFIQEYWTEGIPFYALANVSREAATVALVEWSGVLGRRLIGPWTLPPGSVRRYDVSALQREYSGSLIAVSLNETHLHGLLKPPKSAPDLVGPVVPGRILTSYGLNGVGDRYSNLCCLQETLILNSGQTIPLMFRVPEEIGIVSFNDASRDGRLPQAFVTGATSETLSVETQGTSYVLGAREKRKAAFHEFRLEVKLPEVGTETMAALWGHVTNQDGGGFYFARGLIVSPG